MDAAVRLAQGAEDERTVDQVRAWLVGYAMGDEAMPTPAEFRRALRDAFIRHAAYQIEAASASDRAEQLAERVRTFELLRWPRWEALSELPAQVDRVDALLWRARRLGELPRSWRQLFRLL